MRPLLLCCLLSLLLPSFHGWEGDYAAALERSRQDKQPLLLFFTGSDCLGLAMKMKHEALDTDSFQEKIGSTFHCIEVDFPQHKELPKSLREQNAALKEHFGIKELPTLLILDHKEREIARLDYLPLSGGELAKELLSAVVQHRKLTRGLKALPPDEQSLKELYQLAQLLMRPEAQEVILAAGVESEIPFFQLERYRLLVQEGRDLAKLRKRILKSHESAIHYQVAMIDFQQLASTKSELFKVIKPLEAYLKRFGEQDRENVWRIEMMIAQYCLDADEAQKALKHAETAYQHAPLPFLGEIAHSLEYIKHQLR